MNGAGRPHARKRKEQPGGRICSAPRPQSQSRNEQRASRGRRAPRVTATDRFQGRQNTMNLNQIRILSLAGLALLVATAVAAQDDYLPGPDSQVQPGVPKGEMITFIFDRSKIFPGTVRTCQVYVPAQYNPDHPACLYVGQDGVV